MLYVFPIGSYLTGIDSKSIRMDNPDDTHLGVRELMRDTSFDQLHIGYSDFFLDLPTRSLIGGLVTFNVSGDPSPLPPVGPNLSAAPEDEYFAFMFEETRDDPFFDHYDNFGDHHFFLSMKFEHVKQTCRKSLFWMRKEVLVSVAGTFD